MTRLRTFMLLVILLLPGLGLTQTTTYSYDGIGRLTGVDYGANTEELSIHANKSI